MELFYLILVIILIVVDSYLIQSYATEKSQRIVTNSLGEEAIIPVMNVHPMKSAMIIGASVIVFLAVVVITSGIVIVHPGERGVVFNVFTGLSDNILGEGLNIVIPVINQVFIYDVRRQEYTMSGVKTEGVRTNDDDSMWSPTKEGLQVGLDLTCWFRIDPKNVQKLHQRIGKTYVENTVRPAIRSTLRMVVSGYSIMDVYSEKREHIQQNIETKLREMLAKDNIIVDSLFMRDVRFPAEFNKSIEEKQVAQQTAERMKYILEKEQKEAERKVIEAQGQAKSIAIINEALAKNTSYLEYLKVNKLVDNIRVMVVPTGTNTLIDLKSADTPLQPAGQK